MRQITIVADDKVGVLADISFILGKAKINIESLSAEVQGGKAMINISVKDEKKATRLLSANNYKVLQSEILIVKVKDEPGELSKISKILSEGGVNIESLYLLARSSGFTLDAINVDKPKKAALLLKGYLVKGE
ncbi:TPA: ACT domain-containing protein [Candidatus Micrarchaeota archaeon]|nr:ACT domain-containing protein [Candidatus Micrarchaeota archaeon]HIH30671.1 ACT domain-containing protein [Candidatus Micrarchaeota archaeon]